MAGRFAGDQGQIEEFCQMWLASYFWIWGSIPSPAESSNSTMELDPEDQAFYACSALVGRTTSLWVRFSSDASAPQAKELKVQPNAPNTLFFAGSYSKTKKPSVYIYI